MNPPSSPGRIVMTSFGYNDAGGGTAVPREVSKELARRGWEVTVFHAAVAPIPGGRPYEVREWEEDGVRLVGVHNRPHGLLDLGHPEREIHDPPITAAFARTLERVRPDVVHMHNLHNLGAALLDEVAARGIPSYFSTHNYWLVCPRNYLMRGDGAICPGPGDRGGDCASCVGSADRLGYRRRLGEIRGRFARAVSVCLAVSDAVRNTLVAQGYPAEMIDVVRQSMPAAERTWELLGRDREPGRVGERLVVGFFGSAYWHKGPRLLVDAAQRTEAEIEVRIHGEIPDRLAEQLRRADARGAVTLCGEFGGEDLPELLAGVDVAVAPSLWWDCAPLVAHECLAGRVPLVAPRLGGLAEAVRDGVDGLLFDGLDGADLARKLDRLASEPGLLERLQAGIEPPRPFAEYVDELEAYYAGERPSRAVGEAGATAVRWVGDHTLNTSLSIVNRRVGGAIARERGIALERVERDGARLDPPLPHPAQIEVRHQWPPDLRPSASGHLAVIQPWEFGAVPSEWVERIEANVDELWVPSEFVRRMYVDSGVEADRVQVVPNGVDLELFRPDGPKLELDAPPGGLRFLFVGGLIRRKGPDLLLDAFSRAFAGRDDVTLVVKDFGAGGVYARGDRHRLREHVEQGRLPRVLYLEDELDDAAMAALYRSCDVLVHPYRGEGFAMPVLEAMACGLPVIVTAGGPTDEFCPDEACWRIPSRREPIDNAALGGMRTDKAPWMLEPDADALGELLREAATDAEGRRRRGEAAARAAPPLSWDAVAARYLARIEALRERPAKAGSPAPAPLELEEDVELRVLAAPAWRAQDDRVAELLSAWCAAVPAGTSACLYLLAGSAADGPPEALLEHVGGVAARAGIDLDAGADVTILVPPHGADHDAQLHAGMDAFVRTHAGAEGHVRTALRAGNPVLEPSAAALAGWLANAKRRATQYGWRLPTRA
ncbi:MAG: glycosyltransferase [Thermoleophilaceae bacterium]|nr:glycosyltransferase [Thermoleophilaceae bacterium]